LNRVLLRRRGDDWIVRLIDGDHISEQSFDNFSCATRVADIMKTRLEREANESVHVILEPPSRRSA
jgi:hypothetical protein